MGSKIKSVALTLLCILFVVPACAVATDLATAIPVEGDPFAATLAGIAADGNVTFKTESAAKQMALKNLLGWGNWRELSPSPVILLSNGDAIVVDDFEIQNDVTAAASPIFGSVTVNVSQLAGVILNAPADRKSQDKLQTQLLSATDRGDHLLLVNGDSLAGKLVGISAGVLHWDNNVTKLDLPLETVTALILDPALRSKVSDKAPIAHVGFSDGSRVDCQKLELDDKQFTIETSQGVSLQGLAEDFVAIQSRSNGDLVAYLSDLKPTSFKHIPFLDLPLSFQSDRSVLGTMLRSTGHLYLKGIGVHSASGLTYTLNDSFRRFEADIAIDDAAGNRGSVIFKVFTDDGSGKWQPKFTSEIVRGGQQPRRISVDIAGAKRLSLLVEYADRGDELDLADWLNARLVK